jgi:protein AroM
MFDTDVTTAVLQAGALDGLDRATIAGLAPEPHEHPLVTRLTGGEEVVIAKERVVPMLESAIQCLEARGATLICVLCTGEFELESRSVSLVYPDRLIAGVVDAVMPTGHLGVVIPHIGQTKSMVSKWQRPDRSVSIGVFSPYAGSSSPEHVLRSLRDRGCEMLVLDCMGYTLEIQEIAWSVCGVPVVLANGLVGSVLKSMVASPQAC